MASASKTPNLNLPQWVGTEKPERSDFNAAFDAIDDAISGVRKNIGDPPVMSYGTPQTGWSNANGIRGFRSTDGIIYLSISLMAGTITTNTLVGTIGANLRPKYPIVVECYDFGYEQLNNYKLVVLTNGDIRIRGASTFIAGRRYEGACAYVAS